MKASIPMLREMKRDGRPIVMITAYDHPSGRNRVHMAMQWKAEHLNDCK